MKKFALSMQQPFASLLIWGIKTEESRPKNTKYRGELYIHASASVNRKFYEEYYIKDPVFRLIVNCLFFPGRPDNSPTCFYQYKKRFELGKILGVCELSNSMPSWDRKEEIEREHRYADWEREFVLGDHSSDRFAWTIKNPCEFVKPIPAKGTISPLIWDCTDQLQGSGALTWPAISYVGTAKTTTYINELIKTI